MKTVIKLLAALAVMLMTACGSGPSSKADDLDAAIRDASNYLNANVPKGSKIVILNVQSDSQAVSDYIIDELIANAVNDKVFSVVDRQQLDAIRAEQNFQFSGEVDDKSAMAIGKFFGAQTIVSGALSGLGSGYRMRIRALEVQTAQVQGQYNRNIESSKIIAALAGSPASASSSTANSRTTQASPTASTTPAPATPAVPATPAAKAYKVGDTGPAGGIIFYDKGNNSGGWRYLEAAPSSTDREAVQLNMPGANFGEIRDRRFGAGKENTIIFMEIFTRMGGGINSVPWICHNLEVNGFDDWYQPSIDELIMLYTNTYAKDGSGGFRSAKYVSSTCRSDGAAIVLDFSNGKEDYYYASDRIRARAVRQVPGA